ncbi:MAG TPA: nucleotide sugar dehydrogenase [Pseudonocardiaceae bacterium]|nr:nucleotide sugar dehydrogenase [Pseudonocardiaceae bacterium]
MTERQLSLAVNGRERLLRHRMVAYQPGSAGIRVDTVAIVGLGYVGLPTALALHGRCPRIIGLDNNPARLVEIAERRADLGGPDHERLVAALADGTLELTTDPVRLGAADAVIVCVPTPVDGDHQPELTALRKACDTVVEHTRPGQTVILTSTSFVGTTREMLIDPLDARGLRAGVDVFVGFSPERIDPGNPDHVQRDTPRVVGVATAACGRRVAEVIGRLTDVVYLVSSPDAAEATKLYENVFRAVNLALANEFADACGALGLDPVEVTVAAGTKPYGFLGSLPGPGVGGHCIPCDPYYLLWQLTGKGPGTPLIEQAMRSIHTRPNRVVDRAIDVLAEDGLPSTGARVLVLGVSYKAGVRDLRESSALPLIDGLRAIGADVAYHDPLVPDIELADGTRMHSIAEPRGADWDLVVVHTVHPGVDSGWAGDCARVLDATYQFDAAPHRAVV